MEFCLMDNTTALSHFLLANSALKPRTLQTYKFGVERYIKFAGEQFPPSVELLAGFMLELQQQQYAAASVSQYFTTLRTWINWMHRAGYIATNPTKVVKMPKQSKRRKPRAVPEEVLMKYVNELEFDIEFATRRGRVDKFWRTIRDLAFISLMAGTGSRITETIKLELYDVDLSEQEVTFRETKNGKERTLPFSNRVRGNLSLWLKTRAMLDVSPDITALFIGKNSLNGIMAMTAAGARQAHRVRCKKLGVPYFTPHSLRHFYAVKTLDNGLSINRLQTVLDHANLETTQIYTTVLTNPDELRKVAPL